MGRLRGDSARIGDRFKTKKGYLRDSWCEKSLYAMAVETERVAAYRTLYRWASGIHHGDVTSLVPQFDHDTLAVDAKPSTEWLITALLTAHAAILSIMKGYNDLVGLVGWTQRSNKQGTCFARCGTPR